MKNSPKSSSNHMTKNRSTVKPFSNKKAQDASAAATLVAVLALLIIFYLLFIPPSYRDQILEGNQSTTGSSSGERQGVVTEQILKASPGTLSPLKSEEIEHNIPSVTLYAKTNSEVLQTTSALYVKSSIFGQKKATITFQVTNLEQTQNALLTFRRVKGNGNLIVRLNGNEVYSGEIDAENPEPIRLTSNYLQQGSNTLEFEAERVGWMFWRRNKQQLESLQLTADVRDVSKQESQNVFIASATEKANVKRDVLRFTPECTIGRVGKLNVLINSHSVYYSVPDCGGRAAIEFAPDALREGENSITFESEQGTYLIDLIRITSELKEVVQPTYYFEMDKDDMTGLHDGDYDIMLKLTFVEGREQKSAKINVNGREFNVYQEEREFEKNLNDYVVEGNNAIKVLPDTTLEILSLEVVKET